MELDRQDTLLNCSSEFKITESEQKTLSHFVICIELAGTSMARLTGVD